VKHLRRSQHGEAHTCAQSIGGLTGDKVRAGERQDGSARENEEAEELDREMGGYRHEALEHAQN
jgi:hypothetical protein